MIQVKFLRLPGNNVPKPEYITKGASGMDIYAPDSQVIHSMSMGVIPCGFAVEIHPGFEAQIRDRSGMAKMGLKVFGGTIDSDYRGEVHVMLYNFSKESVWIKGGDRIAQMVFNNVVLVYFNEVDELSETERGSGGFGHTGR